MIPLDEEIMGYRIQAVILVSIFIAIVVSYELIIQKEEPSLSANVTSVENDFFSLKIPQLRAAHVRVRDEAALEEKLRLLAQDGPSRLQVIFDFDRTLSKYRSEGQITKTSYGVFATVQGVPRSYVEQSGALYRKYGPIEEDPHMAIDKKVPLMEQWWEEYKDLVLGIPLNNTTLTQAVVKNNIAIRDGTATAFERLSSDGVPILVFSAGLGDVVSAVVRHNHLDSANVHVVSNFFTVTDGHISGFAGKFIHAFNKNEHALLHTDYFKDLNDRENVILLGDSLGDSSMADGVPGNGTTLKIGFLNSKYDESLPIYLKHFDVVLLADETMDVLNGILSYVLN